MIEVRCTRCGWQESLLLQHDDSDFDLKVKAWQKEHRLTHHAPPVLLVLLVAGAILWAAWR